MDRTESFLFSLRINKLLQSLALFSALFLTVSATGLMIGNIQTVKEYGWRYEITTIIEGVEAVQVVDVHYNYWFNMLLWFIAFIAWSLFVYLRALSVFIENIN